MVLSLAVVGLGTIVAVSSTQQTTQTRSDASATVSALSLMLYQDKSLYGDLLKGQSNCRLRSSGFLSNKLGATKSFYYKYILYKDGFSAESPLYGPLSIKNNNSAQLQFHYWERTIDDGINPAYITVEWPNGTYRTAIIVTKPVAKRLNVNETQAKASGYIYPVVLSTCGS